MVVVSGVCGDLASLVKGAPLLRLSGCRGRGGLRTGVLMGLRCFGPTNDIGSEVTGGVLSSTRTGNLVGGSAAVVRPADNGANVNLDSITTTENCGVVVAVPRAVDIRHELLVTTCNTGLILASNTGNVGNTVTGTGRLRRRAPGDFVPNRFMGPTGPRTRFRAANPRV